jgi:LPS-assembly lipoprotein
MNWSGRFILFILLATLTACGFALRNVKAWPENLQPLRIEAADPYSGLAQELKLQLRRQGVNFVDASDDAITLKILSDAISRRDLSFDERGRVNEYELRYQVEFELVDHAGVSLFKPAPITVTREYTFDALQAVGAAQEEALVTAEMRREIISQMQQRVANHAYPKST